MNKFRTLSTQFYALSLIPLTILLVIFVVLALLLVQMERLAASEEHGQAVIGQCNYLESRLTSASLTTFAYVASKKENYKIHFQNFKNAALETLSDLYQSCEGNAKQEQAFAELQKTSLTLLRDLSKFYVPDDHSQMSSSTEKKMDAIQMEVIKQLWTQFALQRRRILTLEHDRLHSIFKLDRNIVKSLCIIGIVLDILFAMNLVRNIGANVQKRLSVLRENSERIANEQQLLEPVGGKDEISTLDQAFHLMSERLNQALEKERMILRSTVDMICAIKPDGTFVSVNPACEKILQYAPDHLRNINAKDLIDKSSISNFETQLQHAVDSQVDCTFEASLTSSDNRSVHTSWAVRFVPSQSILFCTVRDISVQKEIEQLKQEFIRMISHDIRSPLTTVSGIFEILEHDSFLGESEKGLPLVQKGQRSCQRVLSLTKDLLDIERLDAGAVVLDTKLTDIETVLNAAAENVSAMSETAGVIIKIDADPMELEIDASRITQVVTNIVGNAIKFSNRGSTVTLSAKDRGSTVVVAVTDTGAGIPASALPHIFERFKQVRASDSTEKGGSGLGLAICKSLVELHGGIIACRSEVGVGSTFEVQLPKILKNQSALPTRLDR